LRAGASADCKTTVAGPHQPRATVVDPHRDPATDGLRRFLPFNQLSFNWFAPGVPELSRL
jgi:hypothetical protein